MPSFTLRSSDLCRLAGFWRLVRLKVENLSTRCCIVGAGPCGLMVGLLLTRAGVDVIVLEKHALWYGVPPEWLKDVKTATEDTLLVLADSSIRFRPFLR
jgi:NADPH-dependent 2,4-dienoyl-CoA reductase/sulfur reductase-like enzyme